MSRKTLGFSAIFIFYVSGKPSVHPGPGESLTHQAWYDTHTMGMGS